MRMVHIETKQEISMIRTSTFAVVALAAIAAASFASTGASAHGGGGGGGGHGGGGFAGSFSGSVGHGFGSASYAHFPVAAGIARSTSIARMLGGSHIARSSIIARKPVVPATGTGGAANASGHSNIPTTTVISQLPKPVTPPNPIQDPNHNKPGPGPNFGPGVADVPVVVADDEIPAVGFDIPPAPATQTAQPAKPNCTCLTKRYLDDGSVLFQDTCSKEAALATPAELKLQALKLNR
jgi:hypothetical protein